MIQIRSILTVADNSGAKRASCIKVIGASNKMFASVGDVVVVSIKEAVPEAKVKKGEVAGGSRQDSKAHKTGGRFLYKIRRELDVIINKDNEPVGTRIFGPVARELRAKRFMKIISLAPEVL